MGHYLHPPTLAPASTSVNVVASFLPLALPLAPALAPVPASTLALAPAPVALLCLLAVGPESNL